MISHTAQRYRQIYVVEQVLRLSLAQQSVVLKIIGHLDGFRAVAILAIPFRFQFQLIIHDNYQSAPFQQQPLSKSQLIE